MEREDPDYVFEEDYDDDELEESGKVEVKRSTKVSKERKEEILQNEKNNKENIVMKIVNRLTIGRRKNIVAMILDKIEQMKPKTKNYKKNIPK